MSQLTPSTFGSRNLPSWLLALAISALAAIGVAKVGIDDTYRHAFHSTDIHYQRFLELAADFGGGDNDGVVLIEADDVLSAEALAVTRRLHSRLREIAAVQDVVSVFSARRPRRVGKIFLPLMPADEQLGERLAEVQQAAVEHPLLKERLISADRRASLLAFRLHGEALSVAETEAALSQVRIEMERATSGSGVRASLTGLPAIRVEGVRQLESDEVVIALSGAALATLVAWLLLRNVRAVGLAVVPPLVGVLWSLGLLGWAGKNIDAINAVLPSLVLVIGVSDSTHLTFRFCRDLAAGIAVEMAARQTVRRLSKACFLTALTTAVGFGSLMVSQDRMLVQFGLFSAVSVFVTYVAVMLTFPLVATCLFSRAASQAIPPQPAVADWQSRLMQRLTWKPRLQTAVWLTVTGLLFVPAWQLSATFSFQENLWAGSPSGTALRTCEMKFGGLPLLQVVVVWPEDAGPAQPELLDVLQDVHKTIDTCPVAKAPTSLVNLLASLPGPEKDLAARFGELRYVPDDALARFINQRRHRALVTAYVPDSGAAQLRAPLQRLAEQLVQVENRHPGYRITLTGLEALAAERTVPMIRDLSNSLLLDAVVIFLIMLIGFRSATIGLVSIVPNLLPLVATAAMMHWLGWELRYATAMAFSICLGIATDDTIHFVGWYLRELAAGRSRREAVAASFRANLGAVSVTAMLLITGFIAPIFSSLPTLRAFGLISCAALLVAFVGEVVMLPALLLSFTPKSKEVAPHDAKQEIAR